MYVVKPIPIKEVPFNPLFKGYQTLRTGVLLYASAGPGGSGTAAILRDPHPPLHHDGVNLRVPQGRHATAGPQSRDHHSRRRPPHGPRVETPKL